MPIKRLVCSGCGAKGVAYAGVYRALYSQNLMQDISDIAGTSAGSIAATLIAIGSSADDVDALLMNTDFRNLLGKKIAKSLIMKDGEPILAMLRHQINKTLSQFLNDQHDNNRRLSSLRHKLSNQEPITFGDLSILHQRFPGQFKQLTITAIKLPDGDLQVFNQHETPDVEIALACRASASIPIVLKPVAINLNGDKQFMDGGIYDISPCEYFDGDGTEGYTNQKQSETVVITFHESKRHDDNFYEEVINDNLLEFLVSETLQRGKWNFHSYLNDVLYEMIEINALDVARSNVIKKIMKQITQKQINAWVFRHDHYRIKNNILTQLKNPHAFGYSPTFYERFTRDKIMPWLSQLKLPYLFTDRKLVTREKLTSRYPNQCVNININNMSTGDFKKAQKNKREIIAMSYLDTIEYLSPTAQQFDYFDLLDEFKVIYIKLLEKSKQHPATNPLLVQIEREREFMSPKNILFKIIKPIAEKHMQSKTGYALSRAVEMCNSTLHHSVLYDEIERRNQSRKLFDPTKIHAFFRQRMPRKLFNVLFEPTRKP